MKDNQKDIIALSHQFPLVSIGVASYNNAHFVRYTLDSIRDQTYPNIQLIIVDDQSKDDSVAVIENWIKENQFPCTFIKNKKNTGVTTVCNKLLEKAEGKYFSFLASDDIYLPEKVEHHVNLLENQEPQVGMVYSDCVVIDEKGKNIADSFYSFRGKNPSEMPSGNVFINLLKKNFITAPSVLLKKSVLIKAGGYDSNLIAEDYDLWLRIAKISTVQYDPRPLVKYRRHSSSVTAKVNYKLQEAHLQSLLKHIGYSDEADAIIKKRFKHKSVAVYSFLSKEKGIKWISKRYELYKDPYSFILKIMAKQRFNQRLFSYINYFFTKYVFNS
ncbi:MAG: glycosyltransferase [Bacteroidota bacterium]